MYGKCHREGDKPACIKYYENGNVQCEEYFLNGKPNRNGDKPTYIEYYENGNIKYESYKVNNEFYREGGKPCKIQYSLDTETWIWTEKNGQIIKQETHNIIADLTKACRD